MQTIEEYKEYTRQLEGEVGKWVIIGAIGNIALVVLNAINLWRHW